MVMGLTARLETLSRSDETRSMLVLMYQKQKFSQNDYIPLLIVSFNVLLPLLSPRIVLDNIILLVILLLLCDPITLHLQAQCYYPLPLDGAVTEMKVSLAPHASFDQKQFALT